MTDKNNVGRPTNKEDNRAKLLNAALILFVNNDYHKVSLRAIALKANLDPGLIRYYFKSKLGLFCALVKETAQPVLTQFSSVSKKLNNDSPAQLMQTYYQVMSANPNFPRLIFRIASMPKNEVNAELQNILSTVLNPKNMTLFQRLKEQGLLQDSVDPICAHMSFFSMMIFPFIAPEFFTNALGITITPDFMATLAQQNAHLLQHGLIATNTNTGITE
jgi:AcrR family transcriptional regulator